MRAFLAGTTAVALVLAAPALAGPGPGPVPTSPVVVPASGIMKSVNHVLAPSTAADLAAVLMSGAATGTSGVFATVTGVLTQGHCVTVDSGGNLIDQGQACGTAGANGSVGSGSAGQVPAYAANGNAVTPFSLSGLSAAGATLSVLYGSAAGTAAQGNDSRLAAPVTGLRKGAGAASADTAAAAGTDYLTPTGSGAGLTGITPAQVGATPAAIGALPTAGGSMTGPLVIGAGTSPINEALGVFVKDVSALRAYGYVGDGASHPLSSISFFAGQNTSGWTLAQWQAVLPSATALTDEADWVAIQSLFASQNGSKTLVIPANSRAVSNHAITCDAANTCAATGSGPSSSQIVFTNAASGQAGINQTAASEDKWLSVTRVAVMTNVAQPSNSAITYKLTGSVLGITRPYFVHDVFVGPANASGGPSLIYPFNYYWNVGVDINGASFGEVSSTFIAGMGNKNDSTANSSSVGNTTQPIAATNMLCGIRMSGVSSPLVADEGAIHDNMIFQSQTGICGLGDVEFPHVNHNRLEGVNVGFSHPNPLGASTFAAFQNYMAVYQAGFQLGSVTSPAVNGTGGIGMISDNVVALVPVSNTSATGFALSGMGFLKVHHNLIVYYPPSGATGITTTGVDLGTNGGGGNSFDDDDCVGLNACFDSHGATSGGPNYVSNVHQSGTTTTDRNPSQTTVWQNMVNLPTGDQLPQLALNATVPNASFPSPFVQTHATSPTTITGFANGSFNGPEFTVRCTDTNTSFANGTQLYTLTGGTMTCATSPAATIFKFKPIGQGAGVVIMTGKSP